MSEPQENNEPKENIERELINSDPVHVDYGPLCKSCRDGKFDA